MFREDPAPGSSTDTSTFQGVRETSSGRCGAARGAQLAVTTETGRTLASSGGQQHTHSSGRFTACAPEISRTLFTVILQLKLHGEKLKLSDSGSQGLKAYPLFIQATMPLASSSWSRTLKWLYEATDLPFGLRSTGPLRVSQPCEAWASSRSQSFQVQALPSRTRCQAHKNPCHVTFRTLK